jgi:hypothetical protein
MKNPRSPRSVNLHAAVNILGGAYGYLVAHAVCNYFLATTPPGALRTMLAVLPALPVLWMLWSVHVFMARTDELIRRVHKEALAVAAGVTAAFSIVYGLLEESAGFPHLSARWAILVMGVAWAISSLLLWRRYK